MKKIILTMILAILSSGSVLASGNGGFPLMKAAVDVTNKASLQRGAKYFVNYCMGCHALGHMRYNRLGRDLGISDRMVEGNLIFTRDEEGSPAKVGSLMTISMDTYYAEKSFGAEPPDLTLTARSRGPNWIYTYLLTFYLEEEAPWGVNNAVFPNVGMPHVFWELQGLQKAIVKDHAIVGFETVQAGTLSPQEYAQVALDVTNFLAYAAEPAKLVRYTYGRWALAFLVIFAFITYALKKEYWRDIK
jgi:ubiquinol-cytochrome c reductase cytochrome c1 subunit